MSNEIFIASREQARQIDYEAIHSIKIPSLVLMEHAAIELLHSIPDTSYQKIVIVCGPGNNGADGMALARLFALKEQPVSCIHPSMDRFSNEEKIQFEAIQKLDIPCFLNTDPAAFVELEQADMIVDALFGSGLSRPIEGIFATWIEAINSLDAFVLAIDIPSGLNADTGDILGVCVHADLTIAIDSIKWGELLREGKNVCGTLKSVDIGIPSFLHRDCAGLLNLEYVCSIFPKRDPFSYKNKNGKVLMIGGSDEMPGAISMAADACFHSGVGLLSVFVPKSIQMLLETKMSYVMSLGVPEENGRFSQDALSILKEQLDRYDAFSIGNGMHKYAVTEQMVKLLLASNKPVLVDADGLVYVKKEIDLSKRKAETILTPHLKEMADLLDIDVKEIERDRIKIVKRFCKENPSVVLVLKSSITLIGFQDRLFVLDHPTSALAKGGSGDTLAGIILGLYAWCHDAYLAALCGVYAHSLAASLSSVDPISFTPNDLVKNLSQAFLTLQTKKTP